tara:strand:- start:153 stop:1190 length:1038 start_codon:yes stop_codon:yes gene_type:complete
MIALKKGLAYSLFLIVVVELSARIMSFSLGYGFRTDNQRFISPFFTGTDMPYPILKDETGIFVNGHEIPYKKDKNEIRVVFVGGSTTQNKTNPDGLRYSEIVGNKVSEYFKDFNITVLNAGIAAYSTAHSLINISLRIIAFDPDIIIIHHNTNDLSANYYGEKVFTDYSNKFLSDSFLGYNHRSGFKGFFTRNFKSIRILVWSSKVIKSIFLNNSFNRKGVYNYEDGKGFFSRNLESIIAICKMHDILPVFMTQPNRNLLDNEQAIEYNEIIRNICTKHNVQLFDIAEIISENRNNFIDQIHYSSTGIQEISKILSPKLISIIEVYLLKETIMKETTKIGNFYKY